jgi:hypothetical protein
VSKIDSPTNCQSLGKKEKIEKKKRALFETLRYIWAGPNINHEAILGTSIFEVWVQN